MSKIEPSEAYWPISAVAERTGVPATVLRAWEHRFGFPVPARLDGGHRRYSDHDVERIAQVVRDRSSGLSLEAAIDRAVQGAEAPATLFVALRRERPTLVPQVVGRRTMLAISRAIEDECFAGAERAVLVAAFQRAEVYDTAAARWAELAATADRTVVFAGFERSRRRGAVLEVALPDDSPMRREWAVVCTSPSTSACLAGWERPDGRFEALWTVDGPAVERMAHHGVALAARYAPELAVDLPRRAAADHGGAAEAVARAEAVTNRIVAYLGSRTAG